MNDADRAFLLPGDIGFPRRPMLLSTILGSCVSVCVYDTKLRRGGMNHYMLPSDCGERGRMGRGKYGEFAVPRLVALAERSGSRRGDLVASVYGGGNVTGHLGASATTGLLNIGQRNVETAFGLLKDLGIKVVRHDTGGVHGRKIHLRSATNEIDVVSNKATADRLKLAEKRRELAERKIRVLLIDDSRIVRRVLRKGIERASDIEVVGEAADAYEAREKILELDPDVLCLDIIMPRMSGLTFLARVMHYRPIPTVIVSTIAKRGSDIYRRACQMGAVEVIDKDALAIYQGTGPMERILLPAIRKAAVTVVHGREEGGAQ